MAARDALVRVRQAGLLVPLVLAIAGGAALVSLGNWQMTRKAWKEGLIETIAAGAKAAPLSLAELSHLRCDVAMAGGAEISPCEFRRVRLSGAFDHAREAHVYAGAQRLDGQTVPGYFVFAPFIPAASAGTTPPATILVNRGFVPEALKSATERAPGQIAGPVEIVAQIRSRQTRSWFDGADNPHANVYYVRDPVALDTRLASAPPGQHPGLDARLTYLELVAAPPPGGFPRPLAGTIQLPNRHLEYALTWYGLTAALAAVFAAFAFARWKSVDDAE